MELWDTRMSELDAQTGAAVSEVAGSSVDGVGNAPEKNQEARNDRKRNEWIWMNP